ATRRGGLEHPGGALDVRPPMRLRMRDAVRDRGLRREMVDDLVALHGGGRGLAIQDRGPFHADLPRDRLEIPQRSRRQIVEDRDFVTGAETLDEMGADE